MQKISFFKMSGAGNDFIVIDKDANPDLVLSNTVIKNLCHRRTGIGSDGLITIENSADFDFIMKYYNADGSHGSLCGNGARCAIYFANISGRIKKEITSFSSDKQKFSGKVIDDEKVEFYLNAPTDLKLNLEFSAGNKLIKGDFLNTGSPHVIINIDNIKNSESGSEPAYAEIEDLPVYDLGREIRYLDLFQPGGANINFIKLKNERIFIRTYERGVEDETLACGTGSVASAIIGSLMYNTKPPVTVHTFGGDDLVVNFSREVQKVYNISLRGPAKVIYTGEFLLNRFL